MASGIFRAFKAGEGRGNRCEKKKEATSERKRGQQWHTAVDSRFWMKGDPEAIERIITANMGKWERTRSHICWGKTEEELEIMTGKSPLSYPSHA